MRKALTALAVAGAALAAPMISTGTAYADELAPVPAGAIVANAIGDVAIPGGCTLTYVGKVAGTGLGPVITTGPGSVTITYKSGTVYVLAQETNTLWYVSCI